MNTEQKMALKWAVEQMSKKDTTPKFFKSQWLNALVSALIAFATALLSASCVTLI